MAMPSSRPLPTHRSAQPMLDRLHRANAGRPSVAVQHELRATFARYGWQTDATTMRRYAETISSGRPVAFDAKRIRA